MGYDVSITRKKDYFDQEETHQITLKEFDKLVAEDSEMKIEIIEGEECLVWTNFTEFKQFGNFPFKIRNGEITIKNSQVQLVEQMIYMSKYINARVEGEEGETYDFDIDGEVITNPPKEENGEQEIKISNKKWWKFW